ncbi:MAG: hypothetical protein LBU88_03265 [Treponema sp.]|jgi:hypothetical protein|nr:hypothetical protein [Treponema sp.]
MAKRVSFVLLIVALGIFGCDFFNNPLSEYIDNATSSTAGLGEKVMTDHYTRTSIDGVIAIPPEEVTIVHITIRNAQGYDLDLELEGEGSEMASVEQMPNNKAVIVVTITNPIRGDEFDLTITMSANGRPMPSYPLTKMKALYLNADLASLVVSTDPTFSPQLIDDFDPLERNYTVNVPENIGTVYIKAELPGDVRSKADLYEVENTTRTLLESNITAILDDTLSLDPGGNDFEIDVTADCGKIEIYKLTVIQGHSSARDITEFKITNLSPQVTGSINEATNAITVAVLPSANLQALSVQVTHTGASVKFEDGQPVGGSPATFNSNVNLNSAIPSTFTVTAQNLETKTYTVTVIISVASVTIDSDTTPHGSLEAAFDFVNSMSGAISATITVLDNVTVGSNINIGGDTGNKTITLVAETGKHITITTTTGGFAFFTIRSGNNLLVLGDDDNGRSITLCGNNDLNISVNRRGILVDGGTTALEINNNATIKNFSYNAGTLSSAVTMNGGTFTMNGGMISDNHSPTTSGSVYVAGAFTMNGGTISTTTGNAIYSNSSLPDAVNISGGTVSAANGFAIYNALNGCITVSQSAGMPTLITSANTNANSGGTIRIGYDGNTEQLRITGGTVENTSSGNAILNSSIGSVTITGGTVSANTGIAINNTSTGVINVSQAAGATTLITSANTTASQGTIVIANSGNATTSRLNITGGTVRNNALSGNGNGNAIYNFSTGAVNVSGGTVSATSGIAINNNFTGVITVSQPTGTTTITSANANENQGTIVSAGSVTINGGTVANTGTNGTAIRTSGGAVTIAATGNVRATGGGTSYAIYHVSTDLLTINNTSTTTTGLIFPNTAKITNGARETFYASLSSAYTTASAGQTITVLKNITDQAPITISKNITLTNDGTVREITLGSNGSMFTVTAGTLTITGLTLQGISGNTAALVNVNGGTFNMNSGSTISENIAGDGGGGVVINGGTFNMNSGSTISENTAGDGGGVFVNDGTFNMRGGTIESNTATNGGGVFVNNGTFNMTGGTVCGSSETGFNTSNTSGSASIYVDTGGAANYASPLVNPGPLSIVEPGNGRNVTLPYFDDAIAEGIFEAKFDGTLYTTLTNAIGAVPTGGNSLPPKQITVLKNITVESTNRYNIQSQHIQLIVEENITITSGNGNFAMFNVNGSSLNTSLTLGSENGDGTLTLSGGIITSGSGRLGVSCSGRLVMHNNVTITSFLNNGVLSTIPGGGVFVNTGGTFIMNGGTISNNESSANGGGVSVDNGTFTMNNGTISGNISAGSGGGVSVNTRTFTMNGGTISNNQSSTNGGGVYVINSGTFTMSGGTIIGNGDSDTNIATAGVSIYLNSGTAQYGPSPNGPWDSIPLDPPSTIPGGRNSTIKVINGVLQP